MRRPIKRACRVCGVGVETMFLPQHEQACANRQRQARAAERQERFAELDGPALVSLIGSLAKFSPEWRDAEAERQRRVAEAIRRNPELTGGDPRPAEQVEPCGCPRQGRADGNGWHRDACPARAVELDQPHYRSAR